jgi:hypothetical protein
MTARRRGAQPGNRNAFKTGLHTAEMRALRKQARLRVSKLKSAMQAARLEASPPHAGAVDAARQRRVGTSV